MDVGILGIGVLMSVGTVVLSAYLIARAGGGERLVSGRDRHRRWDSSGMSSPGRAAVFLSALLTLLLLVPVETAAQRSRGRGSTGIGSTAGAHGAAGTGIRGTLGDRIRSGSLQRRILGSDVRRPRSPRPWIFGRPLQDSRSISSRYRGLGGPRGYTGLAPPGTSGGFDGFGASRGFPPPRAYTFLPGRGFHGYRGLWVAAWLDGLLFRLGLAPGHALAGRTWRAGPGLPWTLLAPPTHPLLLPAWVASVISTPYDPVGRYGSERGSAPARYWEEELDGEEGRHAIEPVVPATGPETADLDDRETGVASGATAERDPWDELPPAVADGGRADCATVEARFPSGATTSTWVDFPSGGVSSPDELRALLDEARQPGASQESIRAWRSLIPAASTLPEEVLIRPCGAALHSR